MHVHQHASRSKVEAVCLLLFVFQWRCSLIRSAKMAQLPPSRMSLAPSTSSLCSKPSETANFQLLSRMLPFSCPSFLSHSPSCPPFHSLACRICQFIAAASSSSHQATCTFSTHITSSEQMSTAELEQCQVIDVCGMRTSLCLRLCFLAAAAAFRCRRCCD